MSCRACGASTDEGGWGIPHMAFRYRDVCQVCKTSEKAWKAERQVEIDNHIDKMFDMATRYWYLSVPSGAFAAFVSFMYIHNQVGWDSWYWSVIVGFIGFLIAFMYTVPIVGIALIIGVIWSVDKGVDFLQDKGVLEKKIEEQVIEDKVEDGMENKQEETPAEEMENKQEETPAEEMENKQEETPAIE